LLEAGNQDRYDEFAQVDEPECLEAELALARSLCEQAANGGHHALAATLLATIAKLSAAATAQKVRLGELLEKDSVRQLGQELVNLVCGVIKDRFVGWEDAIEQLADQIVNQIETTDNQPEERKLLEGPK
jgi:hypothetical protein